MVVNGDRGQLSKASLIVELLATTASERASWGVREIAKCLELSTTTIHRTLGALIDIGYVRQDPSSGRYSIGTELMRISSLVSGSDSFVATARPHLTRLTQQTDESSVLARFDGITRSLIFVEIVPGPHHLQYEIPLYKHLSLQRGASGLSVLAHLSSSSGLVSSVFAPRLNDIRSSGVALTHGDRIPGAVGISAPVLVDEGVVMGSVTLTIPESRLPHESRCQQFAALVRECALRIRHDLRASRAQVSTSAS